MSKQHSFAMDSATTLKPIPSNTTPNLSCSPESRSASPNPYARNASRRAIACVTCAKAKTRCDKALPSCSRCTTKGIKCDPRSTRRTSDNNYRTLPSKKPFVTPKRFPTPGILPSSTTFPSSRSLPSSRPRSIMRAPSNIDFRTAVKMSQQAAFISGVPKLKPLPTYQTQIVDECYSYTPSPEPDLRFTPDIDQDGFPFSRGATPQTPAEPFGYNDPLAMVDDMSYLGCQPWSGDSLVPVGLGFTDLDMSMPSDSWMTPEPKEMAQAHLFTQTPELAIPLQTQNTFDTSLGSLPDDWSTFHMPLQAEIVPDAKSIDSARDSGIVMQGEWIQPPQQDMYVDMGNMVTSAPYVPKMRGIPGNAPVWEDVFMPSSIPY